MRARKRKVNPLENDKSVAKHIAGTMLALIKWRVKIEQALKYAQDSHSFDDITLMVARGDLQAVFFEDCFFILEELAFPNYKTLHCFLAGGNLEAMKEAEPIFEKMAKDKGCKYMSVAGRKGWSRVWTRRGWQEAYVVLRKEVTEKA